MSDALNFPITEERTLSGDTLQQLLSAASGQRIVYLALMTEAEKQKLRDAFAKRLAKALVHARIVGSVRAKADAIGVPKSTYEGWYKAEKMPGRAKSIWLAGRLGVREVWLMEGQPPMTDSPTMKPLPIEHMSEADRDILIGVWKSLNDKYE